MSNVFRVVFSLIYNLTSKLSKILKLHKVWSSVAPVGAEGACSYST